ncbi:MAG: T9SS type A sorting domain-containing protein [Brumimicrobium sp.]
MNKIIHILLFIPFVTFSQSYAPPAGQAGSTAIEKDSPLFSSWATDISVTRGYVNIEDTTIEAQGSNKASYGAPTNALGPASGNAADVVSLGDSGIAILTFENPIINGAGYDFAIFENSFNDDYLEFAHVEVSSDGVNYVRFPSHSEVQSDVQIHGFGSTDARRIYNLAGKYKGGYGTPFDLEEIKDSSSIDANNITHVKIIDVVGSIGESGTFDSFGNKINEPFSTPYESGGFDLDGVGVINQLVNNESIKSEVDFLKIFPNPSNGTIFIESTKIDNFDVYIFNNLGQTVLEFHKIKSNQSIRIDELDRGVYHIALIKDGFHSSFKVIVQ